VTTRWVQSRLKSQQEGCSRLWELLLLLLVMLLVLVLVMGCCLAWLQVARKAKV
jgi:hypothetical protein